MPTDPRLGYLANLSLQRAGDASEAGLLLCSLPVPPGAPTTWSMAGQTTSCIGLGQWPDTPTKAPRRLLLLADAPDGAPASLDLTTTAAPAPATPPKAEMVLFASCPEPDWAWDRHYLRLSYHGVSIGLAMGMLVDGEPHWWESCHLQTLAESASYRCVEMGGSIPRDLFGAKDLLRWPGLENPYIQKHNWLNAQITVRMHANGVCEVLARHVNSRFVDNGCDLENCVPIIGFKFSGSDNVPRGAFDGQFTAWELNGIKLDMREPARLAMPEAPGQVFEADGFLVYQPYEGVELFSGSFGTKRHGDPWITRSRDQRFLRGMSRSLPFSLSLNAQRSPRVVRYLPPAWWYGACQEIEAIGYLPVENTYEQVLDEARASCPPRIVTGGFEDGRLPRGGPPQECFDPRLIEPSWEGEVPFSMLLYAWLHSDAPMHDYAVRASWFFHDVAVDHADKLVRMHGFAPPGISLPMCRFHCILGLWLETGWPVLEHTATAVAEQAYWLHFNCWPRSATGRDMCFVRGLIYLYRLTGRTDLLERSRVAIGHIISTQQPDGSFGDQGGGTGIHGWGAYITKPWMNCMVIGPLLDYLEIVPDDAQVAACVIDLADWFMAERFFHQGAMGWSYRHFCKGQRRQFSPREAGELMLPDHNTFWHLDYLARILTFASEYTADNQYFAAFTESFANRNAMAVNLWDHAVAQSFQYLPWAAAHLWRGRLGNAGVEASPQWFGDATPRTGSMLTPDGPAELRWEDGQVRHPATIRLSAP